MNKLGKVFRSFLCLLIFSIVSNTAYCDQQVKFDCNQKEEKIYVSPEQIEITEQAILVWLSGEKTFLLAKSIGFDDQGLYVKQLTRGPCGLHNRWCKICGGCGVLLCPMNCTCYD